MDFVGCFVPTDIAVYTGCTISRSSTTTLLVSRGSSDVAGLPACGIVRSQPHTLVAHSENGLDVCQLVEKPCGTRIFFQYVSSHTRAPTRCSDVRCFWPGTHFWGPVRDLLGLAIWPQAYLWALRIDLKRLQTGDCLWPLLPT
jgi:hypothetical protein